MDTKQQIKQVRELAHASTDHFRRIAESCTKPEQCSSSLIEYGLQLIRRLKFDAARIKPKLIHGYLYKKGCEQIITDMRTDIFEIITKVNKRINNAKQNNFFRY